MNRAAKAVTAAAASAAAAYGAYAAVAWLRFGKPCPPQNGEADPLLDRFLPLHDVAERHHIRIHAPADVVLATACEIDFDQSPIARVIFKGREILLGADPEDPDLPNGLLARTRALGWGLLAEEPGREIVMGAVTQPWEPNVKFRALPPDEFAAFHDPDYVKIAWTLRAEPAGGGESIFRTETRVLACGAPSRSKFRKYWALLSPGIILIRMAILGPLKREAERRWNLAGMHSPAAVTL